MRTVFLINEIVLFSPEEGSLTPRKSWPAGRVVLHAPAAECLHLLLMHARQPVTQKQLFAEVWEKKGVVVSTNTLYQSIASIRKGLKAMGLEEDIIRTLPKQGFQCNADIQFGELSEFIPPAGVPVITASSGYDIPNKEEKPAQPSADESNYALVLSCLVALTMVGALLYWHRNSDPDIPIHYYPAGHVESCTLYSSWSGSEYSQSIFNELRQRYPINCATHPYAYLTVNHIQTGSTLILCTRALQDKGVGCRSIMFNDDTHEAQ